MITEKEAAQYYDQIYGRKGVNAMRPYDYYKQVFDYLGKTVPGLKIADIGVGTGHILRVAVEKGLEAYGVDISSEAVRISRQNVPSAKLEVAPGEKLPFQDNFFDYVVCFGSLEHFIDMDKGISEMMRIAKRGAIFMIVVPNQNYFLWKLRGEFGTKQRNLKETLMDYSEWKGFLENHGLVVKKVYHDPWPWQSVKIFKHLNPWRILRRTTYRFIWLFMPLRYTYQFIFILHKK